MRELGSSQNDGCSFLQYDYFICKYKEDNV